VSHGDCTVVLWLGKLDKLKSVRLDAKAFPAENNIVQYRARPHRLKDKPRVERFIGTLHRACLDECYGPMTAAELQAAVNRWLVKYHYYRPHEALDYMTPAEFSAKMGISIPRIGKRPERS
jgi:transposase InsO family protein